MHICINILFKKVQNTENQLIFLYEKMKDFHLLLFFNIFNKKQIKKIKEK